MPRNLEDITVEQKHAILIILDGVGDLPNDALDGLTPLQAAFKPNLDAIATAGACGIHTPAGPGVVVESDTAHLILFGYDPDVDYPGRGPLEALGVGIHLRDGDIAFRGNLAVVDENNIIIDRRAGRVIPEADELIKAVNGIEPEGFPGLRLKVVHSTEMRLGCRLRGLGLSANVSMQNEGVTGVPLSKCTPLDDSRPAKKTAAAVNQLVEDMKAILANHPLNADRVEKGLQPVNAVMLYGPGAIKRVPSLKKRFNIDVGCVAGNGLIKGLCKYIGMTLIPCAGATGTETTDLNAKMDAVAANYKDFDLFFLHIKATDALGHDRQPERKKAFIERFDQAFGRLLETVDLSETFMFITGDHATPCSLGQHSGDPVPVVMAGPTVIRDHVTQFDETSCAGGYLDTMVGKHFMSLILNKLDKLKKFGA